ncbi:LUC7 related protein [Perilla frutescens var. hirtella]|uniref:LUC7 related protein n=1 Tax=Perilla frutescens var. hirtella TaxID=608512 RepID=A0AAD4PCM6_PERFH|nr:LUC7 related protein [Perilla frutescens var. hirtella]KAH6834386.1 LUC7 related protein [Perilla frutescens var. hirtella]
MDALRKQLDVLMGANRNGDAQEVTRKYFDRDVCRLFLAGLCPHELFQLTKMDKGPCPKVHSLQLRKEYEEAKEKGLDNYDRDLEDNIDRLIVECDRKIERALKRLDEEDAKAAVAISVSEVTLTPEIDEMSKQIKGKLNEVDQYDLEGKTDMKIRVLEEIEELRTQRADKQSMLLLDAFNKDRASLPQPLTNASQPAAPLPAAVPDPHIQEMINEKLKKAEELGEQGMIDEAQKALEEAEALKKLPARQEPLMDSSKYTAADVRITDQKLRVCDICGAFLSVYDSDRRLADHFGGKLHLGYMLIREKLAELQEERDKKRKAYEEEKRSRDQKTLDLERGSSKDRDRGDSRRDYDHRSRDRDRNYDRNRGNDRERARERENPRSYDSRSHRRSRSRSKERSRDYDRNRFCT